MYYFMLLKTKAEKASPVHWIHHVLVAMHTQKDHKKSLFRTYMKQFSFLHENNNFKL